MKNENTQTFKFSSIRELVAELPELFAKGYSYDLKSVSSENEFFGTSIVMTKPKANTKKSRK